MKKIIRKKGDTYFIATHQHNEVRNGVRVKNVYWLECDEKGNIGYVNKDGIIKNETIICRIPEVRSDIDISTLNENCLNNL